MAARPDAQYPQTTRGPDHPGTLIVAGYVTMRAPVSQPQRLRQRIACIGFSEDDVNALRSLLGLLDPYLDKEWAISAPVQADLILERLDQTEAASAAPADKPVIACVRRPRQHGAPAIHRPLRASEILATLNEFGTSADDDAATPSSARDESNDVQAWRLGFWPLEFETFPPAWQQMMAALSARSMTLQELIRCTGIQRSEIDRCLKALEACGALTESTPSSRPGDPPPARWRNFIAGVGRKLGFTA